MQRKNCKVTYDQDRNEGFSCACQYKTADACLLAEHPLQHLCPITTDPLSNPWTLNASKVCLG